MRTEDDTFEVSPKTFNAVGCERTDSEFFLAMADEDMIVVCIQSVVDRGLVSYYSAAFSNEMTDNGNDCGRFGVSHLLRNFVGMRLLLDFASLLVHLFGFPFHSHTEHGSLRLSSALRTLGFLRFVLVGFTSAKVHFVTFNNA